MIEWFNTLLNDPDVNWSRYIFAVVLLFLAFIISKSLRWLLSRSFERASQKLKVDSTKYKFLKNAVSLFVYSTAVFLIIYSVPSLRSLALTLFASAGIMVAILGFAAQQAFSNIISGIFLVIFKPFRVGDLIKVGDSYMGYVEDITLRHTIITDFENRRIIMPNSAISADTIINSTIEDPKVCEFVEMSISYDSNADLAISIIQEEAKKHRFFLDARTNKEKEDKKPEVVVKLVSFGDSSVNLRAWVWARNPLDGREMKYDLLKSIKEKFDASGIEIPFPYRTIVYKDKLGKNE